MKTSLKTVVIGTNNEERQIEFEYEEDCVDIYIDGEKVCMGSWEGNLKTVFESALDLFVEVI